MLYILAALAVIAADQLVKYLVVTGIALNREIRPLIPGVLSLVHLHNDGAAFSLLAGGRGRIVFIAVAIAFTAVVLWLIRKNLVGGKLDHWCLVLVAAGGISNCLDRIFRGYVVDMFALKFVSFPVFNVADVFITVFCIIFIFSTLFSGKNKAETE